MENKKPTNQSSDYVPYRFYHQITNVVMGKQIGVNSKGKPIIEPQKYSVEIIRKQNEFYVNITFDETEIGRVLDFKETPQSDLIAGIDVNPDRFLVYVKQGILKVHFFSNRSFQQTNANIIGNRHKLKHGYWKTM